MLSDQRLSDRVRRLSEEPCFDAYRTARSAVLAMKDWEHARAAAAGTNRPSAYWREELDGIEYMIDASPLIIDKLRHHCVHITGLRPYDYRSTAEHRHAMLAAKLEVLLEKADRSLLVPESPALGGFGSQIDGALYNIDTLKYFETLIALRDGGVLGHFRNGSERRLVWEIGAGWGGFAYQFKTLMPNVTYAVVDLPELFLFSITYLKSTFPDAKIYVFDGNPEKIEDCWMDFDFLFFPNTALDLFRPPKVDLTVNLVSFQEMTESQVDTYVQTAYTLGSPFLYSLNRERSVYNTEIQSVTECISKLYWPHDVSVLPIDYTVLQERTRLQDTLKKCYGARKMESHPKTTKTVRSKTKSSKHHATGKSVGPYKHILGWKRVQT